MTMDSDAVPDYASMHRLDGKRFVILGAGQGIGRQAAHALAAVGARTCCIDLEPERAEAVAAEVGGVALAGDATSREDSARLFTEAERTLGGIDGLVDIIGMARYLGLMDLSDGDWRWQFDIVLRHAWLALQHSVPALRAAGGGPVVFVASASGLTGAPMHAAYGAAKAGLISLTKSAALELGGDGIRVNAVAPGVVWTPRVSAYLGEQGRARNAGNAPLERVALPADIASTALYLASPLSSYVSGQTVIVDGGVGAKFPYPLPEIAEAPRGQ